MVTIRNYHEDDFPAVCAVHDRARPDELRGSVPPEAFRPMADVAADERFFTSQTLVACDGGRVVGFVSFEGAYITWLYVDPAYHRQGVGRQLLRHAMTSCGPDAWTNTLAGNVAARRLYECEGFRVAREFDSDCDGYPCRTLRLALPTSVKYRECVS